MENKTGTQLECNSSNPCDTEAMEAAEKTAPGGDSGITAEKGPEAETTAVAEDAQEEGIKLQAEPQQEPVQQKPEKPENAETQSAAEADTRAVSDSSYTGRTEQMLSDCADRIERLNRTMLRLEKKFDSEILNADNRDTAVKVIYKEMNEYKAGLVEKALKNILYDIADIREMMLSQIKYLQTKKNADSIPLEDFRTYADDIGDLLEKYDVTIYKGQPGEENRAVRQKIVRKVETEDDTLVKKVAESLGYGYEYHSKILYPEKISIYVKKRGE